MQYQGGKWKLRKDISNILKELYEFDKENDNKLKGYIEPFVGGGAVLVESMNWFPENWNINASDLNDDLIILWKKLQNGWIPPDNVTEDLYEEMKQFDNEGGKSALKTFVLLLCSFSRKWRGGLARDKSRKRNLPKESKNRLIKDIKQIGNKVNFYYCFYEDWLGYKNYMVYCDPPYRETLQYKGVNEIFDHDKFYSNMREFSKNNIVVISELDMPNDFKILFEKEQNKSFKNKLGTCDRMNEKLFIHKNSVEYIYG